MPGCGYVDFKSNSVSLDDKIGAPAVFGESGGLADNEHRRSLRVPDKGGLLLLWKRVADEQDMTRLLVLVRSREALHDDSPILYGLLRCDLIERSAKRVFADDPNDERVGRAAKRTLGPFDVAAEVVKEYRLDRVFIGKTKYRFNLLGPCRHRRRPPQPRQHGRRRHRAGPAPAAGARRAPRAREGIGTRSTAPKQAREGMVLLRYSWRGGSRSKFSGFTEPEQF